MSGQLFGHFKLVDSPVIWSFDVWSLVGSYKKTDLRFIEILQKKMVEQIIESADDDIQEEQDNIFKEFDNDELSFHHKVHDILQDVDWNDIPALIDRMDSGPMSEDARQLAQLHKFTILARRQKLIDKNLIMRASYHGYSFHEYPASDFKRKSCEYIQQSGIYILIDKINEINPQVSQQCLANTVEQVERTLKDLLSSKLITAEQFIHMYMSRSYVQLNYLYFVPDTHQEGIPVRPIIICKDGPTMGIMRYLTRLLWSMFNQAYGCKTFSNGADAVHALEQYAKDGHLRSTTILATFNINDFCTRFPHEETIKALEHFLHVHGSQQQQHNVDESLTNEIIIQLVRLVLDNQYFVYENKLYQQIKGGASGSPLTIPLACIYMFHCQSAFMTALMDNKNEELFGRCRDNIFLTWNGSKNQLRTLLDSGHIQISPSIGKKVHFLNVELCHDHGLLRTKVYHDPATDEYELPDKFEYGTNKLSKLIHAALIYGVCCSSTEGDFHDEVRHIRSCHLLRGFSAPFVRQSMIEFYQQFAVGKICHGVFTVPYDDLRHRVLEHHQQQLALKKQRQIERENIISIPYPSDWDLQLVTDAKNIIQEIAKDYFGSTEAQSIMKKIEMVPRPNSPLSMNDYLVDKKPPCRLLTLSESEKNKSLYG